MPENFSFYIAMLELGVIGYVFSLWRSSITRERWYRQILEDLGVTIVTDGAARSASYRVRKDTTHV